MLSLLPQKPLHVLKPFSSDIPSSENCFVSVKILKLNVKSELLIKQLRSKVWQNENSQQMKSRTSSC